MLPSPRVVYATCATILLLQLPAIFFIRAGDIHWGIVWGQGIGIALPLIIVMRWRRYSSARLFPLHWPGIWPLTVTIVATIAVAIVSDALVAIWDAVRGAPLAYHDALRTLFITHTPAQTVERMVLLCALPAVIEEIAFRGFCQTSLTAAYGPWLGLVIAALLFAALHGQPWYLPIYFVLGLFLGLLYQWRGTLWLPIIAHLVNNTWTYVTNVPDWHLPGL